MTANQILLLTFCVEVAILYFWGAKAAWNSLNKEDNACAYYGHCDLGGM